MDKVSNKELAIRLRKKGLSYREILEEVGVAKSTLSLWLRSVGLAKHQKQRLTEKRLAAARRGAEARRLKRILSVASIKSAARNEIEYISRRDLWLIGIVLYWAEGSKEKEYSLGTGLRFSNSDPLMLWLFLRWLAECLNVGKEDIYFEIYIHENYKNRLREVSEYWSEKMNCDIEKFGTFYFKKNKIKSVRRNKGRTYFGLLRICVRKSNSLNRKVSGWIEGICNKALADIEK